MIDFKEALQEVKEAKPYASFSEAHPNYYLVHGFMQLDANYAITKKWQIGFYSPEEDQLAVFNTNPVSLQPFEEAFKDGGTIAELKNVEEFKSTDDIMKMVKEELNNEQYSKEAPTSFIVIVQILDERQVYNITIVTTAFSMITMRIDAKTGEQIDVKKRSILDLKREDDIEEEQ